MVTTPMVTTPMVTTPMVTTPMVTTPMVTTPIIEDNRECANECINLSSREGRCACIQCCNLPNSNCSNVNQGILSFINIGDTIDCNNLHDFSG